MDGGEEVSSTFVVSSRHGSEVLETVDAALHHIAPLVCASIEGGRTSTLGPSLQPCCFRVFALRAHAANATSAQDAPKLPRPIRFVHAQPGRALAWSSYATTRHTDGVQEGHQKGRVARLALRHQHCEWSGLAVGEHVNFAGTTSSTHPKPLTWNQALFSSLAGVLRAPVALRCALMCVLSSAEPSQSMLPSASTSTCRAVRMRCHVPSRDQRTKRS